MDDIYGDLENYNDVNVIEELRNENKELQFKLEECTTAMAKLQKDYDKVSSEYKTLSINFSSLLKTARAEVERKTQIIANLNLEKDTMVLNSIQNSNKSLALLKRSITRDRSNNRKSRRDVEDDSGKANKSKDSQDMKKYKKDRDRNEDKRLPSIDTASSGPTEDTNKIDSKPGKESYDNICESKENIKGKRPQSLRNRRKSMPVVSKYSSDEEYEANYSGEDINRERQARDDKSRRNLDRPKYSHKVSETSGIDEKYSSYHESSRETNYKGKLHRYSDKYRSTRDRYDNTQRFKRHFSPEKSRRSHRDHSDDQYQRHRVLVSPTIEKYDSQRKYRDRRFDHEKDDPYTDRYRNREERMPVKHKTSMDFEEPTPKRVRTDSSTKPVEKEDIVRQKDHQITEEKLMPEFSGHLQDMSCQSPDYAHSEVPSVHSVKEIMDTAEIKLEDPRLTSNRYIKKSEGDKVTFVAAASEDAVIKVLKASYSNTPDVEVPDALQRPPQYPTEAVPDLFTDVHNPVSNMSMESGEINSENNVGPITDYVTESFFQDYENERINQENIRREMNKMRNERKEDSASVGSQQNYVPVKDKIPKVKKPEIKQNCIPNPLEFLLGHLQTTCEVDTMKTVKTDKTFGKANSQYNKNKDVTADVDVKKSRKSKVRSRKMSAREIVEGDLALSDETSDNTDVRKQIRAVKEKHEELLPEKNVENTVTAIEKHDKEIEKSKKHETVVLANNVEEKQPIDETEVSLDIQNKKTKRKSQKKKETSSEEITQEKKIKIKKSKGNKVQEKKKFTELFGESSSLITPGNSLITPEDLGVSLVQAQTEAAKNYIPIFEDAQDANDVNVRVMEDVQTQLESVDSTKVIATPKIPEEISKIVKSTEAETTPQAFEKNTKITKLISEDQKITETNEAPVSAKVATDNLILNTEMTKEPDFVKTVIISTGVQPQIDSIEPHRNIGMVDKIENTQKMVTPVSKLVTKFYNDSSALATSTPYKKPVMLETEIESSCNSSDNGILKDDTSSVDQSSVSNGVEVHNNEDVPDVRIFVRRRRKIKK